MSIRFDTWTYLAGQPTVVAGDHMLTIGVGRRAADRPRARPRLLEMAREAAATLGALAVAELDRRAEREARERRQIARPARRLDREPGIAVE